MKKRKKRAKEYARNWKSYNEQLVKRGEMLFDLEFLDNWSRELAVFDFYHIFLLNCFA